MELSMLGIPSNKIKQLNEKGIYSIPDVLKYIPKKYYDFRNITKISEIKEKQGEMCAFVAKVIEKRTFGSGKVLMAKVNDGTGILNLYWFHGIDMVNRILRNNTQYIFCGIPTIDENYNNMKKMSPILFNSNISKYRKLIPIYKKIKGMSDDYLKEIINKSLFMCENSQDFISEDIKREFGLIDEFSAFKKIHQPKTNEDISAARKRFIFDDLFIWNFILKSQQASNKESSFPTYSCKDWTPIYKELPFDLTVDQKGTLKQIYALMKSKERINALIQGDVGSGKTIVAEFILSTCAENKFQSCLIAPTEVLAKQHYEEICERFKVLGYKIAYLSGATKTKERKEILEGLKNGDIQIIIGTHAIMGKDVVFKNLGMVICDEEHRFGVLQREFYKKPDDYYIENMDYVSEINKALKKLKADKANVFFRDIDLNNFSIEEELKIFKDINPKENSIVEIEIKIKERLSIIKSHQDTIKELPFSNPKLYSLSKELITLIENKKKTNKFMKDLSKDELYALYYLYMPEIKKELAKEIPIPHQIIMSATPIPRTLAMSIYGDSVKVFTIKSRPNGRKPIITKQIKDDEVINNLIRKELEQGYQAYVVCPLIEDSESEKMANVESVTAAYKRFKKSFPTYNVGMINGDMKQEEINNILDRYVKREFDILVSTTIIEVGVNNPNSTIMLILSSDRFGLSSLHQIRGRVGRNSIQSYCILKPNNPDDPKAQIMCSTTDGFEISKEDLKMRGVGDFIGTKQSGKNKYVMLMLAYPNFYEKIAKLNDRIYSNPTLFNKYKFLLDSDMNE